MFLRTTAAAGCFLAAALAAMTDRVSAVLAPDADLLPLEQAHETHPRSTAISIQVALVLESEHRYPEAEALLLSAARLDRRYLPAWTLANFYFRRGDSKNFWPWAARASELCYDDYRPLIRLARQLEPDPALVAERLGNQPSLLRALLDVLVEEHNWIGAQEIASRLAAYHDPSDRLRLAALAQNDLTSGKRR